MNHGSDSDLREDGKLWGQMKEDCDAVMSDVVRRGKQRKWTCDFYQVFHMANIVML